MYKNKSESDLVWLIQLISIIDYKFPTHTKHEFQPLIIINCNRQTKSKSKIYSSIAISDIHTNLVIFTLDLVQH